MIETIKSIKDKMAWLEKEEGNIIEKERDNIMHRLKEFDGDLKRSILLHMAINKR